MRRGIVGTTAHPLSRPGRVAYIRSFHSRATGLRSTRLKSALPLKVVIPLVLGMIASLAIAVYAELGYRRLESANRQMAQALEVQATLHRAARAYHRCRDRTAGIPAGGQGGIPRALQAGHTEDRRRLQQVAASCSCKAAPRRTGIAPGASTICSARSSLELEAVIALYNKEGTESRAGADEHGHRASRTMDDDSHGGGRHVRTSERKQLDDATSRWSNGHRVRAGRHDGQ